MPIQILPLIGKLLLAGATGAAAKGGSRAVDAALGTPPGQAAQAGVLGPGPELAGGFLSDLVAGNQEEREPLVPTGITQPSPIQVPQDPDAALRQLLDFYFRSRDNSGGFQ